MNKINFYKTTLLLITTGLLVSACNLHTHFDERKYNNIQGIWGHKGYGNVFLIRNNSAEMYEYTRNSCLKLDSVDSKAMNEVFGSHKLSNDQQSFTVISSNEVFMRRYSKLDNFSVFCEPNNLLSKPTPTKIFTHF